MNWISLLLTASLLVLVGLWIRVRIVRRRRREEPQDAPENPPDDAPDESREPPSLPALRQRLQDMREQRERLCREGLSHPGIPLFTRWRIRILRWWADREARHAERNLDRMAEELIGGIGQARRTLMELHVERLTAERDREAGDVTAGVRIDKFEKMEQKFRDQLRRMERNLGLHRGEGLS